MLFVLCAFQTAYSAPAAEISEASLAGSDASQSSSSAASATTSATASPVPGSYFGLTLMQPSVTPIVPYSTVRSWDTNHATWTFLNPSRGVYTWRALDNWTSAGAGKDLIYTFGLTPGWAASNPAAGTPYGYGSSCSLPANMDDWDAFVTAIATHVAGKVKYWELWNEPMNYIYWCGDMSTMVTMAQHARNIIKSIDPSAMILAPSTDKGFGEVWIKSFLSKGGAGTIDVMTIHGYPDPYRPESIVPMLTEYRTLMAANGISNLPIWDTEQHGGPQGGVDIAKMYLLEWSSGVSRSILYAYDGGGYLWGSETGLTAAGIAYGEVYKWMVGASLNSPCVKDTSGTYTCNLDRSNYQAEAIWNSTASTTVTVLPQFVQYRDLQGGVHPITNGSVVVGNAPILIETVGTDSTQLSFAAIAQHTYGDAPFPVYASSASNGAVSYSVVSGPASISGSVVTLTGAGTVVLGASQAASGNFLASSASATTVVAPKPVPAIALAPVADQMVYAGPVSVKATSASPAAITYSIVSGPATISGTRITFNAVGPVVVAATQPETPTLAAASTTTTFNVLSKPAPTLAFTTVPTKTLGTGGFNVSATSNSHGQIAYSIVSGPAAISNAWITVSGPGTVVVKATQAEASTYAAAIATTSFNVLPKPVPTLTFTPVATVTNGAGGFNVKASSSSNGAITYAIVSGPATLSNAWLLVSGAGTVTVKATQAETTNYAAATATTSFNVLPKPVPTLTFTPVATVTNGAGGFNVRASSSSNGGITYTIVSGPATISNAWLVVSGAGTVTVKATQAEITNYAAATATTSFDVLPKPVPTLTLPTIATKTNGARAFNVRATSNSNSAITYSIVSGPATASGEWVTVNGVGTVVLKATQAEITNYAAATATNSFDVLPKPVPTLTLPTIATKTNGASAINVRATSISNGAITYSIVSGPATVTGEWVTVNGVGTVVLKASQAEITNYAAATATTSFNVVAKPVPTLTLPTVASKTNGVGPFSARATSNSSGAITYAIVSGPATISGYNVTVTGVGTVVVKAIQAEINTYAAATATTSFSVIAKPVPTLTLPTIATKTNGVGPFSARATSNSSGAITYAIVSGPATISGYNVTVTGVGTVVVKAIQAEINTYAAATATTSFSVIAKPVPTLTFPTIATKTNGVGPFSARATSNSSGFITYAIVSGPATISGSSVTVTGVGTVTVRASQAEVTAYAATTATTSFDVAAKPVPTLTLPPVAAQTYGASPIYLKAASNSNGAITYAIVSGPATISKSAVSVTALGTVTISATQAETSTYAAASTRISFDVVPKPLTFGVIAIQTYGNAPFPVSATSQSTGAVTYSVLSGPANIAGSSVTATGTGTVVIGASQAAAGMYPAMTATTSVNVTPRLPTLAFASIAAQSVDKPPFTVAATSASSGAVTYSVLSGPATISGSTVTMNGVGTVLLGASQAATDNYTAASATSTFTVSASNGSTPAAVAARLLDQSSFGPTLSTIAHVQSVGVAGYLQEQFTAPPTKFRSFSVAAPLPECTSASIYNCTQTEWWNGLLYGPDQLRQRVAFAFSEMFVVSTEGIDTMAIPQYQGVLIDDAFGNYEKMLKDVALTPAMGGYLNMLNSAAQSGGKIANENFARENMQLFTTGINLLHSDGTLQLDGNGDPIPVYTEDQVRAASKAYTGWTYATSSGAIPTVFPNRTPNFNVPMVPVDSAHDTSSKTLLNNIVLPAGQTAEQDLDGVISNLFNHPNTGPFVCRQLIQHLVTSTPSPAYIARVAAVFANNGAGVRGDLQAVVRAILTDEEARAGDTSESLNDGHQREPILFLTGLARGLQITNTDPNGSNKGLSMAAYSLNQQPFLAPSVFNFFPADYMLPGTTTNAPEFGLENTAQVSIRLSLADQFVRNGLFLFKVDLSNTSTLGTLATNPATLVDTLSTLFMHAQMSDEMRSTIVNAITPITSPAQRARLAVYLVVTSPQYNVIH